MRPSRKAFFALAVVLAAGLSLRGDSAYSPRAERIGQQLICMCGCQQGALTCTTLGCTVKLKMQAEIRQRALLNEPDSLVLQSFVQEYGPEVIANPGTHGFDLLAWVMPWVALGFGLALVLFFVRRWQQAQPVAAIEPAVSAQVQSEIERELKDWDK